MIASNVPIGVISKTMRHATLSIIVAIYGHLGRDTAHQCVPARPRTDIVNLVVPFSPAEEA